MGREYSVYFLKELDIKNDDIIYVGRVLTINMSSRMAYHKAKGREKAYSIDGLTYTECRVLEQAGMAYYHTIHRGNPLNNQIRGISSAKGNKYLDAVDLFLNINRNTYMYENILPLAYIVNQKENWLLNNGM